MKKLLLFVCLFCLNVSSGFADYERIVSVDGAVTEIIYALGEEHRLAGVDVTSVFPPQVHRLPKIGYKRTLSSEGILSLNPDLVLSTEQAGPPPVLKLIAESGVPMVQIDEGYSLEYLYQKVQQVSKTLDVKSKGDELVQKLKEQSKDAMSGKQIGSKPRVLFVFHAASGAPLISGYGTAADAMIQYAGGENVVDHYEGYKPLNPEFIVAANPDIILTTSMVIDSLGGTQNLAKVPGFGLTSAIKNSRIVVMDTMHLLGFGPRTPEAIQILSNELNTKS